MKSFDLIRKSLADRDCVPEPVGLNQSAVALILIPGLSGLDALLIRRAERPDDPWSGHMALPGGRREPSDRDLHMTAVRETMEEVGIRLDSTSLLGRLEDQKPAVARLPEILIRPFVFGLLERPTTTLSDEVAGIEWIELSRLSDHEGRATVDAGGERRLVSCYQMNDLVIWGLTYRILRGFLSLIGRLPR